MVVPSKPIDLLAAWDPLCGVAKPPAKPGKLLTHRLEEMGDQYPRSLMNCHAHSPHTFTSLAA